MVLLLSGLLLTLAAVGLFPASSVKIGHPSLVKDMLLSMGSTEETFWNMEALKAYGDFRTRFRPDKDYQDVEQRLRLFIATREKVDTHNAQKQSFKRAVNKFADWSEEETRALRGYKRVWSGKAPVASMIAQAGKDPKELAVSKDWRSMAKVTGNMVHDQGRCGSCWAVSSIGALEMNNEIHNKRNETLSWKQVVDCVNNFGRCGGSGGCDGATGELAFQYVADHGLNFNSGPYRYLGEGTNPGNYDSSQCQPATQSTDFVAGVKPGGTYVRLPENKQHDLLQTLSDIGPVVVSVDASGWESYGSGVFDNPNKDSTVNHAVLAIGYGNDPPSGLDYWLIRNSWSASWGEDGFIRIRRRTDDDTWCGTDSRPLEGVGCVGGTDGKVIIPPSPSSLKVCGVAGILSDSSYPVIPRLTSLTQVSETKSAATASVDSVGNVVMRSARR